MSEAWGVAGVWLLRVSVMGGLLLLSARVASRRIQQPARQQRLAEWSMAAALILALLALGPAWLTIDLPWQIDLLAPPTSTSAASLSSERSPEGKHDAVPSHAVSEETRSTSNFEAVSPITPESGVVAASPLNASPIENHKPSISSDDAGASGLGTLASIAASYAVAAATGLWSLGACVLLGRWLLGYCALGRILRRTQPAPVWADGVLRELTAATRPPRLRISSSVQVPFSCGILRPTIVLPASLCQPEHLSVLRLVLAHEYTHLQRRDSWSTLLFAAGQVIYFFVPWYWSLRRQVRLCQEYVADAAAVSRSDRPEDYAQFLLHLTETPALPAGASGVSGQSSDLFRRVSMMLHARFRVEHRPPRLFTTAAAASLLAMAVLGAGIGLQGTSVEEESLATSLQADPPCMVVESAPPATPPPFPEIPSVKPAPTPQAGPPLAEPPPRRVPSGINARQAEPLRKGWDKLRDELRKTMDKAREDGRRSFEPARAAAVPAVKPPTSRARKDAVPGFTVPPAQANRRPTPGFPFPMTRPGERSSPEDRMLSLLGSIQPTSTVRNGEQFITRGRDKNALITLTGKIVNCKTRVEEIRIEEVGRSRSYKSLEEVPDHHRDRVKHLITQVGKGPITVRSLFSMGH